MKDKLIIVLLTVFIAVIICATLDNSTRAILQCSEVEIEEKE